MSLSSLAEGDGLVHHQHVPLVRNLNFGKNIYIFRLNIKEPHFHIFAHSEEWHIVNANPVVFIIII